MYKKIQMLKYNKSRKKYREYILEGKRLIQSALDCKIKLNSIVCTNLFETENQLWLETIANNQIYHETITNKQFQRLATTQTPSGIAATCDIPEEKKPDFSSDHWLFLDKISDPGNMGSLLRSAAWFGIKNIALSPGCVDPFNPKVVRSGMGAHFTISIYSKMQLSQFSDTHQIIAGEHRGEDTSLYKFPKKYVLVMGNEAWGISKELVKDIDKFISINKHGSGESLNVASAGAILMYLSSFAETH